MPYANERDASGVAQSAAVDAALVAMSRARSGVEGVKGMYVCRRAGVQWKCGSS